MLWIHNWFLAYWLAWTVTSSVTVHHRDEDFTWEEYDYSKAGQHRPGDVISTDVNCTSCTNTSLGAKSHSNSHWFFVA
jgi:hypothetical protein